MAKTPTTKFQDGKGRSWDFSLDGYLLRKVEKNIGINLLALLDDEQTLLQRIYNDDVLFGSVVWQLAEEQADKDGVSEDEFFRSFTNSQMLVDAKSALLEGIASFSHDPQVAQAIRVIHRQSVELLEKVREKGGPKAVQQLAELDVEAEATELLSDLELESQVKVAEAKSRRKERRELLEKRLGEISSGAAPSPDNPQAVVESLTEKS